MMLLGAFGTRRLRRVVVTAASMMTRGTIVTSVADVVVRATRHSRTQIRTRKFRAGTTSSSSCSRRAAFVDGSRRR